MKEYFEEENYAILCDVLEHSIDNLFLKTVSPPQIGDWKTLQNGKKRSAYTEQTLNDAIRRHFRERNYKKPVIKVFHLVQPCYEFSTQGREYSPSSLKRKHQNLELKW